MAEDFKKCKRRGDKYCRPSSWIRGLCGCNHLGKRPRARQAGLHQLSLKAGRPRWENRGRSGGRGLRPFLCPETSSCDRRPGPLQKAGKPSWGFAASEENRDVGPHGGVLGRGIFRSRWDDGRHQGQQEEGRARGLLRGPWEGRGSQVLGQAGQRRGVGHLLRCPAKARSGRDA